LSARAALRAWGVAMFAALVLVCLPHGARAQTPEADLAAARKLFEANLDAIRKHDREAYLACYAHTPHLARTGPTGFSTGYDEFAKTAGDAWPSVFDASDLHLIPVREGVVYGTYRYRVRFGDEETSGLSERVFLHTPDGWRITVTTAFPAPPGTPPPPKALVGATLIDGTGAAPVPNSVVVMRDGRIECAGPRSRCPVPAGIDTVDVRGMWITPGLIDAHVHFSQTGWADGRPDALDLREQYPYDQVEARLKAHPEAFFKSYLACGVTAVFDVGGYPWTLGLPALAENDTQAPHVVAAGPLITTLDHWLNLPAERQFIYLSSDSAAKAGVHYLKSIGSSAVKVWFIVTPTRDFDEMARLVHTVGREAKAVGLPMIVHATGLREAKVAVDAGAKVLVHSVDDKPVDEEFIRLMKEHGTIYCPTLTVRDGYWRMYDSVKSGKPPEVDDPQHGVDSLTLAHVASSARVGADLLAGRRIPSDSARAVPRRIMAANLMRVYREKIPIAMGTDAGNPLTLHGPSVYAEMEAMQKAGMPAMAVLVAATRGGADAMGRLMGFGTLEPGKGGDLLVLSADPLRDVTNLRRLTYVGRGGVVRRVNQFGRQGKG
jgi:imidazolonepropionase-like amidohydrolase